MKRLCSLVRILAVVSGIASTAFADSNLVTYYNGGNGQILENAVSFDYDTVIVSFLLPDPGTNQLGFDAIATSFYGTTITTSIAQGIRALQAADKKVMLSFGGSTVTSAQYAALSQNIPALAASIAGFVKNPVAQDGLPLHFDGIDIDWEDTEAFRNPESAGYNGVDFLKNLTLELRQPGNLPQSSGFLLTHAPQPPYLSKEFIHSGFGLGGYIPVLNDASVSAAIDWINMQYYNNNGFNTASEAVANYQDIVNGWSNVPNMPDFVGLASNKLLVGKPVTPGDAGSGWLSADDVASEIIAPLVAVYGENFGGAFSWQLASDTNGAWAATIDQALAVPEPSPALLALVAAFLFCATRWLRSRSRWAGKNEMVEATGVEPVS